MGRREAREQAFMLLYQMEFQKEEPERQMRDFVEQMGVTDRDAAYFRTLVEGVSGTREELDQLFSPYLKGWSAQRLPRVDVMILRIASYEIAHVSTVPPNVSVNEAVLLARKYSSEESRSYINAVLGKVVEEQAKLSADACAEPS